MAKERIGSNAIFSGPQKGLTTIDKHCYAYSGRVTVTTSATTLLDFNTGKGYILADIQPTYFTADTGENVFYEIYINGSEIYASEIGSTTATTPYQDIRILIPPLSRFEVKGYAASADRILGVTLTGKVYK